MRAVRIVSTVMALALSAVALGTAFAGSAQAGIDGNCPWEKACLFDGDRYNIAATTRSSDHWRDFDKGEDVYRFSDKNWFNGYDNNTGLTIDNDTTSVINFSECTIKLYVGVGYTGSWTTIVHYDMKPNLADNNVGNNAASSLKSSC